MQETQEMQVQSQSQEDSRRRIWWHTPLLLPGKIQRTEEPGELQHMASQRVRHDWTHTQSPFHSLNMIYCFYILNVLSSLLSLYTLPSPNHSGTLFLWSLYGNNNLELNSEQPVHLCGYILKRRTPVIIYQNYVNNLTTKLPILIFSSFKSNIS